MKNAIALEFSKVKNLSELPQSFLKSIHFNDLHEITKVLTRNNLLEILQEYREFRSKYCLCKNCLNFFPRKSYRHNKCPNCKDFEAHKWQLVTDKVKQTKLKKYGNENYNNSQKLKETMLKKYGVENPLQLDKTRQHLKSYWNTKLGVDFPFQSPSYLKDFKSKIDYSKITQAQKTSMIKKYGVPHSNYFKTQNFKDFNVNFILNNFFEDGKIDLIQASKYYNFKTYLPIKRLLNASNIPYRIKRKGTLQQQNFIDAFKNFKVQEEYYIPNTNYRVDGLIENQTGKIGKFKIKTHEKVILEFLGDYWHGNPAKFDECESNTHLQIEFETLYSKTIERFLKLKSLNYRILYIWESDFYESGLEKIQEFTNSDIQKLEFPEYYNFTIQDLKSILRNFKPEPCEISDLKITIDNEILYIDLPTEIPKELKGVKHLQIYTLENLEIQIQRALNGIWFENTDEICKSEFEKIKKTQGSLKFQPTQNKIIQRFQTQMFLNQNLVYSNNLTRRKLIENRVQYLNKREGQLTNADLIIGCKIAGLCKTYSYFSPFWFKYFIQKYKVKTVYDPFGGWGHRMLGGHDLELYIYNDASKTTFENTQKIADFLNLKNVKFYNTNAETFVPPEKFEAIFTCPPYGELEEYEFKNPDFETLIRKSFDRNFKFCGVVIHENFEDLILKSIKGQLIEKSIVNPSKSHFGKSKFEYLYVFKGIK